MDTDVSEIPSDSSRVKKIVVPLYTHHEAGLSLQLKDMSVYLTDEQDFGLEPGDFDLHRHEHALPKYEMARVYLLICALTGGDLGFGPDDRDDPIYHLYEKAYRRCLSLESDPDLLERLHSIAARSGFTADAATLS